MCWWLEFRLSPKKDEREWVHPEKRISSGYQCQSFLGQANGPLPPDPSLSVFTLHNNQPFQCGQERLIGSCSLPQILTGLGVGWKSHETAESFEDPSLMFSGLWTLWCRIRLWQKEVWCCFRNDQRFYLPSHPPHEVGVFSMWIIREGAAPQKAKTKTNTAAAFQLIFLTCVDCDPLCEIKWENVGNYLDNLI